MAIFKPAFRTYTGEARFYASRKTFVAAMRKFSGGLADTGCISDAAPFTENRPKTDPQSEACVSAAAIAEELWAPLSRRVDALWGTERKFETPIGGKIKKVDARVDYLIAHRGGPTPKILRLHRKRVSLAETLGEEGAKTNRKVMRISRYQAFPTVLISYEFRSLRCFPGPNPDSWDGGPVTDLLDEHSALLDASGTLAYNLALSRNWPP